MLKMRSGEGYGLCGTLSWGPRVYLHVLLRQLAVGRLQAASALGHRRLLTVVQLLQSGVPGKEEPHGSSCDHTNANIPRPKAEGSLTWFSGCSSAPPGPTSADLVQIQRFSTLAKPEREEHFGSGPELLNVPQDWKRVVSGAGLPGYLGEEASVALGARLQSKHQTLVGGVEGEGQVRQQAALVLHKERRHTAAVLGRRQQLA